MRDRLRAEALRHAELRAERLGTGADRVLIASGALDEESYVRALARSLGLAFEEMDDVPRDACPLKDDRLLEAATAGLITLMSHGAATYVVAPRHLAARRLVELVRRRPALVEGFRLTTTARLDGFALRGAERTLIRRAADGLRERWPHLSAAPRLRSRCAATAATLAGCVGLACALATAPWAIEALLGLFFIAWLSLRLATAGTPRVRPHLVPPRDDRALPVYTVMAALYREARSVHGLLRAIAQLDYPPEKLDVILALEADDRETHAAINAYAGRLPVRTIIVPDGAPRTKPRALNAALPFARGHYVVVYDAEDRPEPDQLRRALAAFAADDNGLACVQARLAIDNTDDGWLAAGIMAQTPQAV